MKVPHSDCQTEEPEGTQKSETRNITASPSAEAESPQSIIVVVMLPVLMVSSLSVRWSSWSDSKVNGDQKHRWKGSSRQWRKFWKGNRWILALGKQFERHGWPNYNLHDLRLKILKVKNHFSSSNFRENNNLINFDLYRFSLCTFKFITI